MKKLTSQWVHLTIMLAIGTLILSIFTSMATGKTESDYQKDEFGYAPSLSGTPVEQGMSVTSPLTIKSNGDQTNLSVETFTVVSPYLGVVKNTTNAPDDKPFHLNNLIDNPFDNYLLETGMGLRVNDLAEVNLGYRFNNSPSLLDNQNSKPPGDDLRFSLEIKLPF